MADPSSPDAGASTAAGASTVGSPRRDRVCLDGMGARPLHPVALQALAQALDEGWADPRGLHSEGRRARSLLDAARQSLAASLGVRVEEVLLAPGHTQALHQAVRAVAAGRRRAGRRIVVGEVERSAVLNAATHAAAEGGPGGDVVRVPVDGQAHVHPDALAEALRRKDVALAAVQHSNPEVGTLQDLATVHGLTREAGVPLLVDAGSSAGHVPLGSDWDLLAVDPADWGGPRGVSVLGVRAGVRWRPVWPQDEDRWFPGGVSVPLAFAAAASLEAVIRDQDEQDAARRRRIDRLRAGVAATVPDVEVVGDPVGRLPHVLTFSCLYVDGEALVHELDRRGFAVGSGSACTSSSLEPSHVLAAMGVLTHGNVRISLSSGVDDEAVERFLAVLPDAVATVRGTLGAPS